MVSDELIRQHVQDRVEDLALHRSRFPELTDEDWRFFLQQIEGYQRTKDKLPLFAHSLEDAALQDGSKAAYSLEGKSWWYPPRLSCEQCSSEATARYKAQLTASLNSKFKIQHLIDLTGGAGVDTYFMGENFEMVDYVEQNAELCALARHNLPSNVTIHNTTAENFLDSPTHQLTDSPIHRFTTIYIDPARRDKNGGKVFRLEDCTPNVLGLLPRMQAVADTIMIKLSPMLDITAALRSLGDGWQVHVVAVKNEVKEVLLLSTLSAKRSTLNSICAVDLAEGWRFEFTREEEDNTTCTYSVDDVQCTMHDDKKLYLYEPSAAILKAGAYKLVGARYGLNKLDVNTHLYVSDQLINDFPGRVFRINRFTDSPIHRFPDSPTFNVLTRNYVMGAEELKKKLKVRDGGTQYIIGTRVNGKPTLLMAERC
ncbi:MAG: hypothetical protein KBS40_05390 [Bacteroidales bacterium]|nr:hypothetical protein [Bacteroidales bacterium]